MNASVVQLRSVRCSSLPLAKLCPASQQPVKLRLREYNAGADSGTAVHECLEDLPRIGSVQWDRVPLIAKKHGAGVPEVLALCSQGTRLWRHVSALFPHAKTEVELRYEVAPGLFLTGHADGLDVPVNQGTVAHGWDWKTGFLDGDYTEQALGYCALTLLKYPHLTECTFFLLWVRDGEVERVHMTRMELADWLRRTVLPIFQWDGSYQAGKHCKHCQRNHECEAGIVRLKRDAAVVADRNMVARAESELAHMPPEEIVRLLERADTVVAFAQRIREAVKLHVLNHGDVVGGGYRLTIKQSERRVINPEAAWPILERVLTQEELASVVDLHISRAEEIVKKKSGRGNGAGAVRMLRAELEEAGAVQKQPFDRLVVRRA